jgi:hypothetical protein
MGCRYCYTCTPFAQVTDTLTVFLGGSKNFHAIITYDWNLGQYTPRYPG